MMRKGMTIGFIGVFFLLILIPALRTNREKNVVSEIDNRALQEAPIFGEKGYTADAESYLSDRIGFRTQMIQAYTDLNDILFHEMVHPTYTYGQDGYVFFKMHDNVQYSAYHEKFADMLLKMQTYCEDRGVKFYFMFNPEKIGIYQQYLPKGVIYNDDWVDTFFEALDARGINYVDNRSLLKEKSKEYQVFNVQYNAGHWNDLGCFFGMNNLFSKMHEDFPDVRELTYDDFNISTTHRTSLQVSQFAISEDEPRFEAKGTYLDLTEELAAEIEVDYQNRHVHYYLNEAEGADKLPRVLIFQGSYLNSWTQYLFNNTSSEVGIHNYQNIFNLPYYFNAADPDAVIFEVAEYTFQNKYFTESKLESTTFPPALTSSEGNIKEEMEALIATLPEFPKEIKAQIHAYNLLEDFEIDSELAGAKYVYLYTGEKVYDLVQNADGRWHMEILKDLLTADQEYTLIITDENELQYFMHVSFKRPEPLDDTGWVRSEGVSDGPEEGQVTMHTEVEGNAFSFFGLQVYNEETGEYTLVDKVNASGMAAEGFYYHTGESGYYSIVWRGNSNLKDEMIYRENIYLEKGYAYSYSFAVESLNPQEIIINKMEFCM